jgi:putative heme-binding domain-containing protein
MRTPIRLLAALAVAVVGAAFLAVRADPPAPAAKRVPWKTSHITGSPEAPPPYRTERAFPKLKFAEPVTITRAPGSERLFVAELRGKLYSFPDDQACEKPDLFLDLGAIPGHWRTYGLVFHPDFAKNRFVYACYVLKAGDPKGSRVSRFKVTDIDPPRADLKSETIILEWPSGGHNGGCLQFGPDGFLYISTGDGSNPHPADVHNTGQDIGDLLSSILRIDVDATDPGKAYRVPPDNPFVKTPGARPEVWAYGLRNPWKMSFDAKTGALWVGDVGWEMWEMVYRVEKGGNYGWSVQEGSQTVRPEGKRGPTPILPPTVEHDHTEARSLTGGRAYYGKRFPELSGVYVYGDYVTGKLWGLKHDGKKVTWKQELANSPLEVIDFGEGRDGELYILDHGGTVGRLVPDPAAKANADFPRKLSETGLFTSVKDHAPAPGVMPYAINAEPWADHATAERLFATPNVGTLGLYEKSNLQAGIVKGEWIFPGDTVLTKTLSLEMERGNPASKRRLETQVLHQDRGTWRAYTYVWNDEQTDAVLAPADGFDRTFTVKDASAPGGKSQQTWHFAARTECLICHTTRAGSILGFNVAQLNRDRDGENQLRRLDRLGLFEKPLPSPTPRLPVPSDPKEKLEARARAYLHANCAHCHRRGGGGTAPFELLFDLDLQKTALVGSRPSQGTFEIPAAQNVAAGDPYRSVLYHRMAKLGPGHMPYAGSNVIDAPGLDLIHEWIRSLPAEPGRPPSVTTAQRDALERLVKATTPAARAGEIGTLLASTSGALYLLRAIDTRRVEGVAREEVVAAARKHPAATVRDLFERFIPEGERVKRLGNSVKAAAILALPGDAARGREFFLRGSGAQCRNCHRVGKEGTEVGPDLTQIGKKLDRAQLLESILEPSKRIDPEYVTYTLETTGEVVYSGILVKKTPKEVVLRDAQAKLITVPADEVARLVPAPKSLMPELLVRDMTAEQVADLLAFLASLK